MARVAGNDAGYTFRLMKVELLPEDLPEGWNTDGWTAAEVLAGKRYSPTEDGFVLPSATTIISEVLAKPPSAMAWWGYRVALEGVYSDLPDGATYNSAEELEQILKDQGVSPNISLETAGDRGHDAHDLVEMLANQAEFTEVLDALEEADKATGAEYGQAALDWWETEIQPHIATGAIDRVASEARVVSLEHRYAGTLDLAVHWTSEGEHENVTDGWEIIDIKTHKPASGFTKPGRGPGYVADAAQIRAYRIAWEEMGLGQTIGQRTVVLRDKSYRGNRYLEDAREVTASFFLGMIPMYHERLGFEAGGE